MHTITLEDEWFETMELFGEPIAIIKDELEWHYWNEKYQIWQSRLDAISKRFKIKMPEKTDDAINRFEATFGSWQDDRSDEEIIEDIYDSRTPLKLQGCV